MSWRIHSWSPLTASGTIDSPHFGPVAFDRQANVDAVTDFELGEPVMVELQGTAPPFVIRALRPMRQRQPSGTEWPPFDAINSRFGDVRVEKLTADELQLWLGNCCDSCTPDAPRLSFHGVTSLIGLHDDLDFSNPLFRLASEDEKRAHHMAVPDGSTAYCIVSSHGNGPDGPSVFVVAMDAHITPHTPSAESPDGLPTTSHR